MSELRLEIFKSTTGKSGYLDGTLIFGFPRAGDAVVTDVFNVQSQTLGEILNNKEKCDVN